ncbi:MAG: carbohydrate ABC transporter permease [Eubacteriales bacterium]
MGKSKTNSSMRGPKKRELNAVSVQAEVGIHIVIGAFALACIIPFIFVFIIAFTSEDSIRAVGYSFFPQEWSLEAFTYIQSLGKQLWLSYFNSFYITILGTFLSVFMTMLYAYAVFRKDFKYRQFFTFFCFFTMLFGGGLAPTVVVTKALGMNENYAALIVPMLLNPFNLIIMRTFFQSSVPDELIESASIDGSGEYNTLFKIIVPIAKPGIATVSLLTALAYWNDWYLALLYVANDPDHMPLQYLLIRMQQQADFLAKNAGSLGVEAQSIAANLPSNSLKMALVVLIVVPIACAYPFFQRYIISGLTIGAVKG